MGFFQSSLRSSFLLFLLSSSVFLSFLELSTSLNGFLIKILYKLIIGFNKNLACFTIGHVLRRLNAVCTINVAFDAIQKLTIIIKTYFKDIID